MVLIMTRLLAVDAAKDVLQRNAVLRDAPKRSDAPRESSVEIAQKSAARLVDVSADVNFIL